jgi:hypothetical protein
VTVHLSTPASPKTAACGDATAKRFSHWRWKVTCVLCKAATAAVAFDKPREAFTMYFADVPIRYSKLVEFVRANGGTEEAILEFERDKRIACPPCTKCGMDLTDPIALVDVEANRMVFGCPGCSEQRVRERWEREGRR